MAEGSRAKGRTQRSGFRKALAAGAPPEAVAAVHGGGGRNGRSTGRATFGAEGAGQAGAGANPRALTAYQHFSIDYKKGMDKQQLEEASGSHVSKMLTTAWHSLSAGERARFKEVAERDGWRPFKMALAAAAPKPKKESKIATAAAQRGHKPKKETKKETKKTKKTKAAVQGGLKPKKAKAGDKENVH